MRNLSKLLFLILSITAFALITSCDDDIDFDPSLISNPGTDPAADFADYFEDGQNINTDPGFNGLNQPMNDLGAVCNTEAGTEVTSFKGAIDPNATPWFTGWSSYESILDGGGTNSFTLGNIVNINDSAMSESGDIVNWTNDNTYVLSGIVFVNPGQTLNIEAGTIIQGVPGEGANSSALVIARDATLNANGTAEAPIIFTFEGDNGGQQAASERGRWGGLIVLGNSSLNSNPGESAIEGIDTNEPRGLYGGVSDDDSSGVIRYISIRHGGTNIGADNEINGLTLGGVGSGTTIEFVEIVGNDDDGIEWFGGTANVNYLLSLYCGDDALDYDEGYRGVNQFIIIHQDPTEGEADRGGEHDGGTNPEQGTPFATPVFANVTSIGNPGSRTITFRDNAGGEYYNSIFYNYGAGIDIEDIIGQGQDSFTQFEDNNLRLECNVFSNIGAGTTGADLFTVSN